MDHHPLILPERPALIRQAQPRLIKPDLLTANLQVNHLIGFGAGGDGGNDSFVKLLMHADGADGSTSFIDSSSAAHTISRNGSPLPTVETDQSKFGGSSAFFSGGWLSSADSTDWDMGSGDFTFDWWEYRTADASGKCAVARAASGTFVAYLLGYSNNIGSLQVYMSSDNASWDVANAKTLGTLSLNVWSHRAVVRSGTNFYCFKDGTQTDTWTSSSGLADSSSAFSIGSAQQNLGVSAISGYIDELRVSKGVARWTSNFTPPSSPYF